jgi:hypothetical protein
VLLLLFLITQRHAAAPPQHPRPSSLINIKSSLYERKILVCRSCNCCPFAWPIKTGTPVTSTMTINTTMISSNSVSNNLQMQQHRLQPPPILQHSHTLAAQSRREGVILLLVQMLLEVEEGMLGEPLLLQAET